MARRSPSWKDFKDLGSICWKDLNVQDTNITISSEEGGNYAFLEAFFHGICIMRGHEWFLEKLEPLIWDPQFTAEVQEPEGASAEIVFNVGELVYDRIMDELNFALYDYYDGVDKGLHVEIAESHVTDNFAFLDVRLLVERVLPKYGIYVFTALTVNENSQLA